jgi:hypothetical protein
MRNVIINSAVLRGRRGSLLGCAALLLVFLITGTRPVFSHEGHSHADETTESDIGVSVGGPVNSLYDRVEARLGGSQMILLYIPRESGQEQVSAGSAGRLVLFLEDYNTATPKAGATLELTVNFVPFAAQEHSPGIYTVEDVILSEGAQEIAVALKDDHFPAEATVTLDIQGSQQGLAASQSNGDSLLNDWWLLTSVGLVFLSLGYLGARFKSARDARQRTA